MKLIKILLSLLVLTAFIALINSCSNDGNKTKEDNSEAVKLEELRKEKQHEADSLRAEIELLKAEKDSINKRIEDEQN